jgi:type IX secretion system PorP/SprF family membrane protein
MRRIILGIALGLSWMASAQQDVQFTQFTQNKLLYNPGYTANRGSICLDLLHRSQWVGFDNAPTTQNFNADIPISFLHGGLGLIVTNDQIGFFQDISFGLSYGYQMDLAGGKLGFGLMVDFKNKSVTSGDWVFPDGNLGGFDPFVAANGATSLSPDLNFGVYFENDKVWGGLSTTRGIEGTFALGSQVGAGEFAFRSKRHYYLMGGYNWYIPNTNWALMPAIMVKSDLAGPMTADVNVNAMYNNKVWGGVTYRNQDALAIQAGLFILPSLKLGYSYDITLSDISVTSGGSHEIMLGYCFRIEIPAREKGSNRNPRFL